MEREWWIGRREGRRFEMRLSLVGTIMRPMLGVGLSSQTTLSPPHSFVMRKLVLDVLGEMDKSADDEPLMMILQATTYTNR